MLKLEANYISTSSKAWELKEPHLCIFMVECLGKFTFIPAELSRVLYKIGETMQKSYFVFQS
jgi:hypothetical protein